MLLRSKKGEEEISKKKAAKKSCQKAAQAALSPRPFPAETLEEAIRIPQLIRELMVEILASCEVARALGLTAGQTECGTCQLVLVTMALLRNEGYRLHCS